MIKILSGERAPGKSQLGEIIQRAQFITRLSAAAGLLAGAGHRDCQAAVQEAMEVVRDLPFSGVQATPPVEVAPNIVRGWMHPTGQVSWGIDAPSDGCVRIVAFMDEVSNNADA